MWYQAKWKHHPVRMGHLQASFSPAFELCYYLAENLKLVL